MLFPLACLLRELFLRAAIMLFRTSRNLAYKLFVPGLGFADLSAYCRARLRALQARHPHVSPLSRDLGQ
jgi:hypothetical protein